MKKTCGAANTRRHKINVDIKTIPAFEILYEIYNDPKIRHVFTFGGRGGAKSISIGDHVETIGMNDKQRILCIREVQKSIRDSAHALLKGRIDQNKLRYFYEVLETIIKGKNGTEILFSGLSNMTEESIKSFFDVKTAWVEEAQAIKDKSLRILLPTIRSVNSKILFSYNRTRPLDPVHSLFLSYPMKKQRMRYTDDNGDMFYWNLHRCSSAIGIEINYDGNPLFPGVLEQERVRAKEDMHVEEYNHVWLGMPEPQPADSILSVRAVTAAMERKADDTGNWLLAVDVARNGKDGVEIAIRKGLVLKEIKSYRNKDKTEIMRIHDTGRRVLAALPEPGDKSIPIIVDDTGLGGGLTDWLIERGFHAIGVAFNQSAVDKDRYTNAISEMWFDFCEIVGIIELPSDTILLEDLTNRSETTRDTSNRRAVESKDKFKSKIGRSPDKGDVVLLAFYNKVVTGGEAVLATLDWNIY